MNETKSHEELLSDLLLSISTIRHMDHADCQRRLSGILQRADEIGLEHIARRKAEVSAKRRKTVSDKAFLMVEGVRVGGVSGSAISQELSGIRTKWRAKALVSELLKASQHDRPHVRRIVKKAILASNDGPAMMAAQDA